MSTTTDHQKAFITLFESTARYHHRHKVFEDFVSCAVAAIHNKICHSDTLEAEYMRIIKGYEREDLLNMAHLLSHVTLGLAEKPCDFLGSVFMQLELGDKYRGQFFTPWPVAYMMAQMNFTGTGRKLREQPFVTFYEPACGAGCMALSFAAVMEEKGWNPDEHLWVMVVDIDPLAADMAFIQLSLNGIPAQVRTANALTDAPPRRILHTPMHHVGNWQTRLNHIPHLTESLPL
uniref:N-6 DNA methylase n=1 Tax=Scandinavium goeteborgense TaxID=1851514 RepID=UPI00135BCCD5|nr:N-6 DNA methylase [Scandinavium goeteborgense]